jgi:hypothetical protein
MHRVVAVLIAVSALPCTQVASAADIPAKAPPPVSIPLPVYNWTGFSVGGDVGDRNQAVTAGFVTPETVTSAPSDIQTVWARVNVRLSPFIGKY